MKGLPIESWTSGNWLIILIKGLVTWLGYVWEIVNLFYEIWINNVLCAKDEMDEMSAEFCIFYKRRISKILWKGCFSYFGSSLKSGFNFKHISIKAMELSVFEILYHCFPFLMLISFAKHTWLFDDLKFTLYIIVFHCLYTLLQPLYITAG